MWYPTVVAGVFANESGEIHLEPYRRSNGAWFRGKLRRDRGPRPIVGYKGKKYRVSRLVCSAFHGEPQPGAVAMHLNDNPKDNRPENLKWGTQKENLNTDTFKNYCRSRTGDNNPRRKGTK